MSLGAFQILLCLGGSINFFSPKVVCNSSRVKEVRNTVVTLTEPIFVIEVFNCSEVGVYLRDIMLNSVVVCCSVLRLVFSALVLFTCS